MNHLKITQSELAKICGVSQGTVDRALNGRGEISEKTRKTILAAAKKYGFRPSKGNTKVKPIKTIGVILFDLNNQFFSKLITDIEDEAKKKGYLISVMFTHYNQEAEIKCIRQMYSSGVDAILLCSVNSGEQFSKYLSQLDIPIIGIGNKAADIPYVGVDDFTAMKNAAEYLQKKYDHIVYYSPALCYDNAFAQKRRYEGFMSAAKNYSIVTNSIEIKDIYPEGTAVLCSTDHYAMYVYTRNKNVKIMGFDNLPILDKLKLPIDSVDTATSEIAVSAIRLIESKDKEDIIIGHKIIKR